ncbi:MAG: ABC transporter ATP-binding protein [Ginsengibacter sp.]
MKPILEVQHITKQFKIGAKQERYLSLRDAIAKPFRRQDKNDTTFYALNDVSFDVYPGESVGIIGRNGAGKSTLLKILSKITPPTHGKIICRGRVASLLEVGTGFHPELSGRENIYMNGSILGMRKFEIDKHFDAIVEFSGVEKFLDTPLKRFSSGMQLRLAFSVAAFLEPEILIIDEVLAVGDAAFQKKCLGKMDEVSKSGRTVLFVSHDMNAIEQLCKRVVILEKGQKISEGATQTLISNYLSSNKDQWLGEIALTEEIQLSHFDFHSIVESTGSHLQFQIRLDFIKAQSPEISDFCILIYSLKGVRVAVIDLRPFINKFVFDNKHLEINGFLEDINLVEEDYAIGLYFTINNISKEMLDLGHVRVKPPLAETELNPYQAQYRGFIDFSNNIKIS